MISQFVLTNHNKNIPELLIWNYGSGKLLFWIRNIRARFENFL